MTFFRLVSETDLCAELSWRVEDYVKALQNAVPDILPAARLRSAAGLSHKARFFIEEIEANYATGAQAIKAKVAKAFDALGEAQRVRAPQPRWDKDLWWFFLILIVPGYGAVCIKRFTDAWDSLAACLAFGTVYTELPTLENECFYRMMDKYFSFIYEMLTLAQEASPPGEAFRRAGMQTSGNVLMKLSVNRVASAVRRVERMLPLKDTRESTTFTELEKKRMCALFYVPCEKPSIEVHVFCYVFIVIFQILGMFLLGQWFF